MLSAMLSATISAMVTARGLMRHGNAVPGLGAIFGTRFGAILDALVPARCPVCTARSRGICTHCRELLPWITVGCEICGTALYEVGVCGGCQTRRPRYDHSVIPLHYRAPVSEHIQTLKYHRQLNHADSLGALICRRVWQTQTPLPDLLIPVPLHPRRLRERGYNQALEITRRIATELDIEVDYSSLARIKNTIPQVGLGGRARRRNVRGAFQTVAPIRGAHVALVDDVVTSGSTVNAAAHALKQSGVTTVSVWAAAKT